MKKLLITLNIVGPFLLGSRKTYLLRDFRSIIAKFIGCLLCGIGLIWKVSSSKNLRIVGGLGIGVLLGCCIALLLLQAR